MSLPSAKILLPLLTLLLLIAVPKISGDEEEGQWCVADEQTPDYELQGAINWACGDGGADCSSIQENQACYEPNTVKDHASYVFNTYYQKFKHQGATCNFNNAAMITELDPSHNNCHFEYLP